MMKAILFALFVFSFSLWGAEPKVVSFDKLQKRGKVGSQLTYIPNQDTPFTGKAVALYSNGQKKGEKNFKNGELDGRWLTASYFNDGQLEIEASYNTTGEMDGPQTEYWNNGQFKHQVIYKNGKKHGRETYHYPNGKLQWDNSYRNGKEHGEQVRYHENGAVARRFLYKNGVIQR